MAKSYLTNKRADKRKVLKIEGLTAILAVPYTLHKPQSEFRIGNVRFYFKDEYTPLKALDPIPDSWLVDLSEDVRDLSEPVEPWDDLV